MGRSLWRVAASSIVVAGFACLCAQPAWAKTVTATVKGQTTCTVGSFGTFACPLTFAVSVTANETLTLPTSVTNALFKACCRSIDGTATTDNVYSSDATPSPFNMAAPSGIPIPLANIRDGHPVHLRFPISATVTAGAAGTETLTAGELDGTLDLYALANGGDGPPYTITLTCSVPSPPVVLATVKVK